MDNLNGLDTARQFGFLFTGQRSATPAMGVTPLEAKVISATSSQVVVTINGFDTEATFTCFYEPRFAYNGTANVAQIPPAGTLCLVAFPSNIGQGTPHSGWVMSFTAWPTS